jgi:hypothetical protein
MFYQLDSYIGAIFKTIHYSGFTDRSLVFALIVVSSVFLKKVITPLVKDKKIAKAIKQTTATKSQPIAHSDTSKANSKGYFQSIFIFTSFSVEFPR